MDRSENGIRANGRLHEATNWFEFTDSRLYDIDYYLWVHQKDLSVMRGAVHKMRSALPANAAAYLRGESDRNQHLHADNTLDHENSHVRMLDSAERFEPNDVVSELMEASTDNPDETTAHVTENRRSTVNGMNAVAADVRECKIAGRVAHIQQLQSAVPMGPAERAGSAKESSEKQRVGLRRSLRLQRQT